MEEIEDDKREQVKLNAIATWGAKADDLDDFLKTFDKKVEVKKEEDHQTNMAMLNQKL